MSEEEEMKSLGRLVKSASDAKKNVVLLKGNLEALSASLTKASGMINGVFQGVSYPDIETVIRQIPPPEAVQAALTAYLEEKARSAELSARLTELGM